MVIIPFSEFPNFTEEVVLDGKPYRITFLWNARAGRWAMGFYDLAQNPIVQGIPISLDQELLHQYHAEAMPPGELWAVDPTGLLQAIGRRDLIQPASVAGQAPPAPPVYLAYIPQAEL